MSSPRISSLAFLSPGNYLARTQIAHDSPRDHPRNLAYDKTPVRGRVLFQADPGVFILERAFGQHGFQNRQRDGGAEAAQHGAARNGLAK